MKNFFNLLLLSGVMASCASEATTSSCCSECEVPTYENIQTVRLTVSEGKRLIAKGIAENKQVKERLESGVVIITRGTTNTYIAEEIAALNSPAGSFVTGKILPTGAKGFAPSQPVAEIILINGERAEMSYDEALTLLKEGDIVFKGANLLNYSKGQAAVNIGAPGGGTVGKLRKYTDQGLGEWIIPIGLEKDCSADLLQLASILDTNNENRQGTVLLNVATEGVYTEIEALKEFATVDIFQIAMGGIGGAEGGVSLMICGSKEEVDKAVAAAKSVHGEKPFI